MPESTNTQDFVARPVVDDQISVAPPTEPTTAQLTTRASDNPTQTQQSAAANIVQVRLTGAKTWGDTQSHCLKAKIKAYADKNVSHALVYQTEGCETARAIQDMTSYVNSRIDELEWPASEEDAIKAGSIKPSNTLTYQAWKAGTIPTLQGMAKEHNDKREGGDWEISVLGDGQRHTSGYSVMRERHMREHADRSRKSELERAKSSAEASRGKEASDQ